MLLITKIKNINFNVLELELQFQIFSITIKYKTH